MKKSLTESLRPRPMRPVPVVCLSAPTAAFERMSYRERVAFKREDPEGYALMKAAL